MQPLDLLPTAPVSTNTIETSSPKDNTGKPALDGEFGRLMERAMSPDQKAKDNPDNLSRKTKPTATATKSPATKSHSTQNAAASDAGSVSVDSSGHAKAKTAAKQTDVSPTTSKETSITDLTLSVPTPADNTSMPLPILLSLTVAEHPATANANAGNAEAMALAVNASATQPGVTTGGAKALATLASNTAVAAVGINSGILPETSPTKTSATKVSAVKTAADKSEMGTLVTGDKMPPAKVQTAAIDTAPAVPTTSVTALAADLKNSATADDVKTVPPSLSLAGSSSEPDKTAAPDIDLKNSPAVPDVTMAAPPTSPTGKIDPNRKTPALATSIPAQTDSKIQVISSFAAKPAESLRNDGTGVAITASSMKNSDKTNKVAGLDVQDLPGGTNGTARETVLPAHAAVTAVRSSEKQNSDLNLSLPSTTPATTDAPETSNIIALPSLTDARMRDVERTHDLVSVHALRMVDSKSDSLQVVLKPGAGTELSLELRHRDGGIEAAAVLQRGDYQLMNQHWPELQAKLEQRGIKLAPLGGETNSFTTGNGSTNNGSYSQQQSSREEAAQQASAFAEFTVAMNRGGATARLAPAITGGWESWA